MNMSFVLRSILTFCLLMTLPLAGLAIANSMRERPFGPPPEAFSACEGKEAGDAVTMETPDSRTIQAVCQVVDDRLAARPVDDPPPRPGNKGE